MNNFTITESAEGEFILSVQGRGSSAGNLLMMKRFERMRII